MNVHVFSSFFPQHTMCKQQNLPVPTRSKDDPFPTPLPSITAFDSDSLSALTRSDLLSNQIEGSGHVTVTSSNEIAERLTSPDSPLGLESMLFENQGSTEDSFDVSELESEKYTRLIVEEALKACLHDPEMDNLTRGYEVDMEEIDQQLLELGPFAQGVRIEDRSQSSIVSSETQVTQATAGKRTRRLTSHGKVSRKNTKLTNNEPPPQEPGDREKAEEEKRGSKERGSVQRRGKWRKVGSAGRRRRTKTEARPGSPSSQILDSNSTPDLNSPTIIPAASEMEMLSLYLPNQLDSWTHSPSPPNTGSIPNSVGDPHALLSPQNMALESNLSQSTSSLVSDHADVQPKQHPSPPASSTPSSSAPFLNEGGTPTPTSTSVPHHFASQGTREPHQQVVRSKTPATKPSPVELRPTSAERAELRTELYMQETDTNSELKISRIDQMSDSPNSRSGPPIPMPELHPLSRLSSDLRAGFSIAQLTAGGGTRTGNTSPISTTSEHSRSWTGERIVHSPSGMGQYVDVESPLVSSYQKRRNSSTSSHRSVKQQSFDEVSHVSKASSPFPQPVSQGEWGSSLSPSSFQLENKPYGAPENRFGSPAGANPYTLWVTPGQMTSDTAANALPRYPYPNPFLHANWLQHRGPVLGTTLPPFHPMFAPLDPNNPYVKPMFSNPYLYRYPFAAAQGLKSPFPLTTCVSTQSPQPQPMQISGAFTLSQPSLYPLPTSPNLSAFKSLSDIPSRSATGTPPILQQQPPFGGDDRQPSSGDGVNWVSPSLLPSGVPYFGPSPFTLGPQKPLTHGSLPQAAGINLSKLAVPLSSSPLALISQSSTTNAGPEKSALNSVKKTHRRSSSATSADLNALREPVIRQPDPFKFAQMEAKAASLIPAQVLYGTDVGDQLKRKPTQEPLHVPSTSVLMPPFLPSAPGISAPGETRPHVTSHMITTTPQPPGHMTFVGGHMIPVGFATQPIPVSVPMGLHEVNSSGGRGSPRGNNEKMKFRIHQVKDDDFKSQGKPGERKRRRPWRGRGKRDDGRKPSTKLRRQSVSESPTNKEVAEASTPQSQMEESEMHGLDILAACSSIQSKEGEKEGIPMSFASRMRSPVSLAGANTLLLLGNNVEVHQPTTSAPTIMGPYRTQPGELQSARDTQVEGTVVDSLLQLSANSPAVSSPPSSTKAKLPPPKQSTRSASYSAAEAMLMLDTVPSDGGHTIHPVPRQSDKLPGHLQDGAEDVFAATTTASAVVPASTEGSTTAPLQRASKSRCTKDSEATDTDSEATLSPTSPHSPHWMLESGPKGGMESGPKEGMESRPEDLTPEDRMESKPEGGMESRPEDGMESRPEERMESKPEDGMESRPEDGMESRPQDGMESRPEERIESKPEDGMESRPEERIESKPEDGMESKPEERMESRPEDGTESGPTAEKELQAPLETSPSEHLSSDLCPPTHEPDHTTAAVEQDTVKSEGETLPSEEHTKRPGSVDPLNRQQTPEVTTQQQSEPPEPAEDTAAEVIGATGSSEAVNKDGSSAGDDVDLEAIGERPPRHDVDLEAIGEGPPRHDVDLEAIGERLSKCDIDVEGPSKRDIDVDSSTEIDRDLEAVDIRPPSTEDSRGLAPSIDADGSIEAMAIDGPTTDSLADTVSQLAGTNDVAMVASEPVEIVPPQEEKSELTSLPRSPHPEPLVDISPQNPLTPAQVEEPSHDEIPPSAKRARLECDSESQELESGPCESSQDQSLLNIPEKKEEDISPPKTEVSDIPVAISNSVQGEKDGEEDDEPSGETDVTGGSPLSGGKECAVSASVDKPLEVENTNQRLPSWSGFVASIEPLTSSPEPSPHNSPEPSPPNSPEPILSNSPEPISPNTPEAISPNSPEVILPNSPEAIPPNSPEAIPPNSPEVIPPNSPEAIPPNCPKAIPPNSPEAIPPNSPEAIPPNSPEAIPPNSPEAIPPIVTYNHNHPSKLLSSPPSKESSRSPRPISPRPPSKDSSRSPRPISPRPSHLKSQSPAETRMVSPEVEPKYYHQRANHRSGKRGEQESHIGSHGEDLQRSTSALAPQNRLPVGKTGFDKYQHQRQFKKHGRDSKHEERKKRPRPSHETAPWPKGLFEVDPKEMRREKRTLERHPPPPPPPPPPREERFGFRNTKPPPGARPGYQSSGGQQRSSAERKYAHPRSFAPEEAYRHSKGDLRPPHEGRSHSREPGKPRSQPSSRQESHAANSLGDQYGHPHSPTWYGQREREFSPLSDEEGHGRLKYHPDFHKRWPTEELHGSTEHLRERSKHTVQRRHPAGFEAHSKKQYSLGTEVPRKEWKTSQGSRSSSPERRKQHKLPSVESEKTEQLEPDAISAANALEASLKHGHRKRRREDDSKLSRTTDVRRKSYESISDDELAIEVGDSRDPSLVFDDRSSHDSLGEHKSVSARKARKRRLSSEEHSDNEDSAVKLRHKKLKHRKWGRTEGKVHREHKSKSDDRHRHGHHKHS